jgi:hypothetical protein
MNSNLGKFLSRLWRQMSSSLYKYVLVFLVAVSSGPLSVKAATSFQTAGPAAQHAKREVYSKSNEGVLRERYAQLTQHGNCYTFCMPGMACVTKCGPSPAPRPLPRITPPPPKPVVVAPKPAIVPAPKPIVVAPKPPPKHIVVTPPKPFVVTPPRPVVVAPKPVVVPPKPIVVAPPNPVVVTPPKKPLVVEPRPVVVPPKPLAVEPRPVVVPPKPVVVAPKPVVLPPQRTVLPPARPPAIHIAGIQGAVPGHLSLNRAFNKDAACSEKAPCNAPPTPGPAQPTPATQPARPGYLYPTDNYPVYMGKPDFAFKPALCSYFPCDPTEVANGKFIEKLVELGCTIFFLEPCSLIKDGVNQLDRALPSPDDYSDGIINLGSSWNRVGEFRV